MVTLPLLTWPQCIGAAQVHGVMLLVALLGLALGAGALLTLAAGLVLSLGKVSQ